MNSKLAVVVKVFLASAGLAAAIKYIAPYLNIRATSVNALALVLLPTLLMSMALGWRASQQPKQGR